MTRTIIAVPESRPLKLWRIPADCGVFFESYERNIYCDGEVCDTTFDFNQWELMFSKRRDDPDLIFIEEGDNPFLPGFVFTRTKVHSHIPEEQRIVFHSQRGGDTFPRDWDDPNVATCTGYRKCRLGDIDRSTVRREVLRR